MSESQSIETSKARAAWNDIVHAWPIIVTIVGLTWGAVLVLGDAWVSNIVSREYNAKVKTEPVITAIRAELVAIDGRLANAEGNDVEIRNSLGTVITRLDQVIAIQLQAANRRPTP